MSHKNKIIDRDPCFEVDAITRAIRNVSSIKTTVMQYDHNSERFSFTLPRFIEGHDMMESTKAEVHYLNVDTPGLYTINDLSIDEADESKVKCTWLISQNATLKVGALEFLLRFSCVAEDGSIEYAWNTGIHKGIAVSKGLFNTEAILEQNPDALEQMKETIKEYVDEKIGEGGNDAVTNHYNGLDVTPTQIDLLSVNILNDGTASIAYGDYPGNYSVDELVIPYEVEYEGQTYPVSTIGNSAFWEAGIKKLIIPDTIKMIEPGAFYQTGINEIIFCGDDIKIQTGAFDSTLVTDLNLPKNVKFYDEKTGQYYNGVFSNSLNLKALELPEGSVKKFDLIGNSPALERVNIPRSTKEILPMAFWGCTSLKEIEIPKGIEKVNSSAFAESGIKNIYYEGTKNDWDSILVDDMGMGMDVFEGITILYDYTDGNGLTAEYVDEKIAGIEAKVNAMSGLNSLIYYGNANIVPSDADIFSLTVLNEANGTGYLYPLDFPGNLSGEIVLPYEFEFEGKVYKNVELGDSSFAYAACDSLIIPNSVKVLRPVSFWQAQIKEITFCGDTFEIKEEAFMDCTTLTDVYYRGRESDWNKKVKGKENIPSTATIHFLGI